MIGKAIVFAAGMGTRLKPWTDSHPKALAPVAGEPMLKLVLQKLKAAGVTEAVVNVHHFSQQIIDYLRDNGNFGLDIHISDESDLLLDTGGGIAKAADWLQVGSEPVVVHNVDILTEFPLADMAREHRLRRNAITLLTSRRATSRYLLFDDDERMSGWTNVTTGAVRPERFNGKVGSLHRQAYCGVMLMEPSTVREVALYGSSRRCFSIIDFLIDRCSDLQFGTYHLPEGSMWHDIGKPESLMKAEEEFLHQLDGEIPKTQK